MKEAEIHSTGPGLTVQISETTSALELMMACRDAGICPVALKEAFRLVDRDDWEAAGQEIGQAALEVIPLSSRCGSID